MASTIIYNRVSTKEQNPELQKRDCIKLAESLGLKEYEFKEEKESAWKEVDKREIFEYVKNRIKSNNIDHLIVWDFDRVYRNRKKFKEFLELLKIYHVKLHSVRQSWLEQLHKVPEPWNEIVYNLMIDIYGSIAEEESNKKSMRTKNAVVREDGKPTKSYKGKLWGRKNLPERVDKEILELRKNGHSIREIAESITYIDRNKNQKNVSIAYVHKILKSFNDNVKVVLGVIN